MGREKTIDERSEAGRRLLKRGGKRGKVAERNMPSHLWSGKKIALKRGKKFVSGTGSWGVYCQDLKNQRASLGRKGKNACDIRGESLQKRARLRPRKRGPLKGKEKKTTEERTVGKRKKNKGVPTW